jgi:hypothetical protein
MEVYGGADVSNATFTHVHNGIAIDGTASIASTQLEYADTAYYAGPGAQVNMSAASIVHVTDGLVLGGNAQVTFRGTMTDVSDKAIQACKWGQGCTADAAYSDWGTASGPQGKVCGSVTVTPWTYGGVTQSGSTLFVPNCDNSPTPQGRLDSSITGFQGRVNQNQIDCDNGFQDACHAIDQAYACLTGALNLAASQSPWPLPPAGTAEQVNAFGNQVLDGASTYITSQEEVSVAGFGFALANELTKVFNTFTAMSSAYSSCG